MAAFALAQIVAAATAFSPQTTAPTTLVVVADEAEVPVRLLPPSLQPTLMALAVVGAAVDETATETVGAP